MALFLKSFCLLFYMRILPDLIQPEKVPFLTFSAKLMKSPPPPPPTPFPLSTSRLYLFLGHHACSASSPQFFHYRVCNYGPFHCCPGPLSLDGRLVISTRMRLRLKIREISLHVQYILPKENLGTPPQTHIGS